MEDHEPSALIPLSHGMVLSFINYELLVEIKDKDQNEKLLEQDERSKKKAQPAQRSDHYEQNFDQTYAQKADHTIQEESQDPRKKELQHRQEEYERRVHGTQDDEDHRVIK